MGVYKNYKNKFIKSYLAKKSFQLQRRLGRMFGVFVKASHSQFAEDLIIEELLAGRGTSSKGIYIDVGCNHPIGYNNFYKLYQRGWRGINIDGNQEIIDLYKEYRKGDVSICAVVSNHSGPINFIIDRDDCLSRIVEGEINRKELEQNGSKVTTHTAVQLNDILQKTYWEVPIIDVLSIDVETFEIKVLQSLNLEYYKPYLIVVEMLNFDVEKQAESEVYNYLKRYGYILKAFAIGSGYFVSGK